MRESEYVRDHRTGEPREIDILIEHQSGIHSFVIAIECIAHKRPAPVTWVEQMRQKHHDVPVNKTILVSRSGFTKTALVKADQFNMEAITLQEAMRTNWARFTDKLVSLNLTVCIREPIHVKIQFDAPVPDKLDRNQLRFHSATGEDLGNPREILKRSFFTDPKIKAVEGSLTSHASKDVTAIMRFPPGTYAQDPSGNKYGFASWTITCHQSSENVVF